MYIFVCIKYRIHGADSCNSVSKISYHIINTNIFKYFTYAFTLKFIPRSIHINTDVYMNIHMYP
jgi:hypothetical protein